MAGRGGGRGGKKSGESGFANAEYGWHVLACWGWSLHYVKNTFLEVISVTFVEQILFSEASHVEPFL